MKDNVFKYKDTSKMTNITALITSRCTLKCKLCATYSPCHPHPSHYPYETLTKSISRYFDSVTKELGIFTISGGEPFMHPQLPEFIEFVAQYEDRVKMIEVITNATIVPSDRLIQALKCSDKINLLIDNYGEKLSVNLNGLLKKLDENDIAYRLRNYTTEDPAYGGWIDVSDFGEKNRQEQEVEELFSRCAYNNIHKNIDFIINGRVHMCYVFKEAVPAVEELPSESVNLMDDNLSNADIANQIEHLRSRKYLMACKNCNGYMYLDGKRELPAEQMD